jgi:hypothetical protein
MAITAEQLKSMAHAVGKAQGGEGPTRRQIMEALLEAATVLDGVLTQRARREAERRLWESVFAATVTGYMSDPSVDPSTSADLRRLMRNCEEIANAAVDCQRRRWFTQGPRQQPQQGAGAAGGRPAAPGAPAPAPAQPASGQAEGKPAEQPVRLTEAAARAPHKRIDSGKAEDIEW